MKECSIRTVPVITYYCSTAVYYYYCFNILSSHNIIIDMVDTPITSIIYTYSMSAAAAAMLANKRLVVEWFSTG